MKKRENVGEEKKTKNANLNGSIDIATPEKSTNN
jgi:hypothetical protein